MLRKDWWKIFRLPSPIDLGWSDINALPMDRFKSAGDDTPTWEDWEVEMRKNYPVRFFFAETFPHWYRRHIKSPIKDAWYWVKCHTLPSHRYHFLDLRQPKSEASPGYKFGWIDSDTQMLYAAFNILNNFVKHELPNFYCPSEEEVQADASLLRQRTVYLEAKAIHYWWNVERLRQLKLHLELLHKWGDAQKAGDANTQQLWDDLHKLEAAMETKEDEMFARLLKIRRSLWT